MGQNDSNECIKDTKQNVTTHGVTFTWCKALRYGHDANNYSWSPNLTASHFIFFKKK